MPELPEVEHAASRLRKAALGRTIASLTAFHPAIGRWLPPADRRRLVGRQIASITRRAKMQIVRLSDDQVIEVHFRMTGDWGFGRADEPTQPGERLRIALTDGTRVSLIDTRAFAVVRRHAPGTFAEPPLGPEPLDEAFTADVLAEVLKGRRGPIKPVLLDQRVVAGLGNIYAAEALWLARIHPARAAGSLSKVRVARLRDAIRTVLQAAGGRRYYRADGTPAAQTWNDDDDGAEWRVYDRAGEPCARCTRPVKRLVQAGRSTFLCTSCQH